MLQWLWAEIEDFAELFTLLQSLVDKDEATLEWK